MTVLTARRWLDNPYTWLFVQGYLLADTSGQYLYRLSDKAGISVFDPANTSSGYCAGDQKK